MSRILKYWGAAAIAVAGLVASDSLAQTNQAEEQGTLIEIGPDHGEAGHERPHRRVEQPGFRESQQIVSRYWIGIAGGVVPPELRSHLRIDKDQGVIVREVEGGSPADEGGLEKYDVIVRVNGDSVGDMGQLADVVGDQGEMQGQLALEVIRHGQNETVYVTPVEKPIEKQITPQTNRRRGHFGRDAARRPLRGLGQLPGGMSLSITREGGSPAKVTIRQGDQTWNVDMGDPESLAQLPEELRPLVEQAMGEGPAVGFLKEMLEGGDMSLPFGLGQGGGFHGGNNAEMQRRLQEMEQQMEELRRRFGMPEDPALSEPPLFKPQEGTSEVEIPAES